MCVCKSVFPLRPLYLCRLFVLALEWDRSPSRGTLMAFQVFPLSSLEVTPCRKYTARSSQLIANTYTQQQQQVDFHMPGLVTTSKPAERKEVLDVLLPNNFYAGCDVVWLEFTWSLSPTLIMIISPTMLIHPEPQGLWEFMPRLNHTWQSRRVGRKALFSITNICFNTIVNTSLALVAIAVCSSLLMEFSCLA